ncbi:MAG TPA: alkaline phosphatase family protein, partial [Anaerolineae bacterium]
AFDRAHTPNFNSLLQHGASATDARTIFPTITGPAHTSILTGARVGTHGFLYPKMLDAYGNRLFDFTEGLMQAETIAEAWRPRGITSAGIGSRFLRGADMQVTEASWGRIMKLSRGTRFLPCKPGRPTSCSSSIMSRTRSAISLDPKRQRRLRLSSWSTS